MNLPSRWFHPIVGACLFAAGLPNALAEEPMLPRGLPAYAPETPWASIPVERTELNNGMRVWIVNRAGPPRIDMILAIQDAGHGADSPQTPGFAQLLASLVPSGTAQLSARAIAEQAQEYGGVIDATAMNDGILVSTHALSSHAAEMLRLLANVTRGASFPEEEVRRTRDGADQALKVSESQPRFAAEREVLRSAYGDHPYARTQLTHAAISALQSVTLRAEHAKRFRPSHGLLVIAGPISAIEGLKLANDAFGDWQAVGPDPEHSSATLHPPESRRVLAPRQDSVQALIMLGSSAPPALHADHFPLLVAAAVLGGGWNGRLMRNLRHKHGYTYGAGAQYVFSRFGGAMMAGSAVRNEVAGAALTELRNEYHSISRTAVPPEEIEHTKRFMIGTHLIGHQEQAALANSLASNWLLGLPSDYVTAYGENVRKVSVTDVARVASRYLDRERQTIVVVGDERAIAAQLVPQGPFFVCPSGESADNSTISACTAPLIAK